MIGTLEESLIPPGGSQSQDLLGNNAHFEVVHPESDLAGCSWSPGTSVFTILHPASHSHLSVPSTPHPCLTCDLHANGPGMTFGETLA